MKRSDRPAASLAGAVPQACRSSGGFRGIDRAGSFLPWKMTGYPVNNLSPRARYSEPLGIAPFFFYTSTQVNSSLQGQTLEFCCLPARNCTTYTGMMFGVKPQASWAGVTTCRNWVNSSPRSLASWQELSVSPDFKPFLARLLAMLNQPGTRDREAAAWVGEHSGGRLPTGNKLWNHFADCLQDSLLERREGVSRNRGSRLWGPWALPRN